MRAFFGMVIGLVMGYFVGYFMVISRGDDLGTLGSAVVMAMAPTAPDTLMVAAIGAVLGLLIGAISGGGSKSASPNPEGYGHPHAKRGGMDMSKLATKQRAEPETETTVDMYGNMRTRRKGER